MITIKDIQIAVGKTLTANGYTVMASEVKEGFDKPACFVDVFPVNATVETEVREFVTDSVEISYRPAIETREDLIENAEKFKNIFLYSPIEINNRFLSVNEITFDVDKTVLKAYFELEFYQETETEIKKYPLMKDLEERVVTQSYGTSEDTH